VGEPDLTVAAVAAWRAAGVKPLVAKAFAALGAGSEDDIRWVVESQLSRADAQRYATGGLTFEQVRDWHARGLSGDAVMRWSGSRGTA
jgi:hypothetical protein